MRWLEDVHAAIERGDGVTLRAVAEKELKPETRMFLTLLADIIDQHFRKAVPLKRIA